MWSLVTCHWSLVVKRRTARVSGWDMVQASDIVLRSRADDGRALFSRAFRGQGQSENVARRCQWLMVNWSTAGLIRRLSFLVRRLGFSLVQLQSAGRSAGIQRTELQQGQPVEPSAAKLRVIARHCKALQTIAKPFQFLQSFAIGLQREGGVRGSPARRRSRRGTGGWRFRPRRGAGAARSRERPPRRRAAVRRVGAACRREAVAGS